jgi:4-hydroxybenzoate polyprenyltransferase
MNAPMRWLAPPSNSIAKMTDRPGIWSDIKTGNWVDHYLPPYARPYARLMRLDRSIGTWLLLLPCWWSVTLAGAGFPNLWFMFLFALGAVVMRGAGCVVNDIYDRKLDAQVERTSIRPLASGEIKLWQALIFLKILLLIGFGVLLLFNKVTIITGILSLLLIFTYPLMKRITWWPQLFLGFTFNWGALVGWTAVTGGLAPATILLYIAGIFWTLGYDTIYAHQDKQDDVLVGIKSTARLFGDNSRPWIAGFYTLAFFFLVLAGFAAGEGQGFYTVLAIAAGYMVFQLALWRMDDPENCLQRFRSNRDIGLIIWAALLIGKFI